MKRTVIVFGLWLLAAGCTIPEIREGLGFAGEAAIDTATKIAVDPSLLATPQGIATLIAIFVSGFAAREIGALSVRGTKNGAGLLARLLAKFFTKKGP